MRIRSAFGGSSFASIVKPFLSYGIVHPSHYPNRVEKKVPVAFVILYQLISPHRQPDKACIISLKLCLRINILHSLQFWFALIYAFVGRRTSQSERDLTVGL